MHILFDHTDHMHGSSADLNLLAHPAGIIYVSDSELGWEPVVKSWLAKRDPQQAAGLQPCFQKYLSRMLEFIRVNLHTVMYNETACTVNTLLTLLNSVLKRYAAFVGSW